MNKKQRINVLRNLNKNAQSITGITQENKQNGQEVAEDIFKKLWNDLSIEELEAGIET